MTFAPLAHPTLHRTLHTPPGLRTQGAVAIGGTSGAKSFFRECAPSLVAVRLTWIFGRVSYGGATFPGMTIPAFHDRWLDFVAILRAECASHNQDSGVLETDEADRKVSLPLQDGSRYVQYLQERAVIESPRQAASEFYKLYLAAREV